MSLMIVESPAKAKTIGRYFDKKMQIIASFGHVRDLPSKKSAIDVKNGVIMNYQVPEKSKRHVDKLYELALKHPVIYLATDPDREGEAIAWHILQILKERNAISDSSTIKRVVFNEITKEATNKAVENCRDIDMDLVNSQQARRAIDHLFGLSVSELLWTILPGSRSAGRVQSVALRLIYDREIEIMNFKSQEYWDIEGLFNIGGKKNIPFSLIQFNGTKLDKFSIPDEKFAITIEESVKLMDYKISSIKTKNVSRKPSPPFVTSTLQQEAHSKLRFSPKKTMMIAQKLYEGIEIANKESTGLITYMRTDGLYMSDAFITQTRNTIRELFGANYVPEKPKMYKSKAKNSQEAHEAIRPTDVKRTPLMLKPYLTDEQLSLYELIWKRAVASQISDAEFEQVTITIESMPEDSIIFSACSSKLIFDGFYIVYGEQIDNSEIFSGTFDEKSTCNLLSVNKNQHFTQAPPRYSEAMLIKKMEEIGIGRPSTYATILSVIQDRDYAVLDKNKSLVPSTRGQMVTVFLVNFLTKYVEYNFTMGLEEQLDLISSGKFNWKELITNFWSPLENLITSIKTMDKKAILTNIDKAYFDSIPVKIEKKCSICGGVMIISASAKGGIFLGCSNYPECKNIMELDSGNSDSEIKYPIRIGTLESGEEIFLKKGPYGFYIQTNKNKVSLPSSFKHEILLENEELSRTLSSMPITVCKHPETGEDIQLGINKIGLFVYFDKNYYSLKKPLTEIKNITIEEIFEIISKKPKSSEKKLLGKTSKGKEVYLCNGKYGKYVKSGKINASIKGLTEDDVTLEKAIELLEKK